MALHPSWAKRSKRAISGQPRLHPVLESMVLSTFEHTCDPHDLTWLWVGGRHVSKHFRCEIERMFRTVFLPETILRCNMGSLKYCWDIFTPSNQIYAGCYTQASTGQWFDHDPPRFTLDRFSDDHSRAFFKYKKYKPDQATVFRRLHEKQLVGAPAFSIQIREVVNDTGLPDLQIDDSNQEISFSWIGMLDQLMGEEHVFNTILSQRLGWHLDLGDDETLHLLTTHRKLARRSRYQRECRAKYGTNILEHFVHDECVALENLQRLRRFASASGYDDGCNNDNDTTNNPFVYTRAQILASLPPNTTIYSGNANPSRQPGSIPRGIFTEWDYCSGWSSLNRSSPPPSAADLFSHRPLPDLSQGRRVIRQLKQRSKRIRDDGAILVTGKRERTVEGEGDEEMVGGTKRRKVVSEVVSE